MLGKAGKPELKAKAAETHGLLECAVNLLRKYQPQLRACSGNIAVECELLLAAGSAAMRVNEIIGSSPRVMSREALDSTLVSYLHFCTLFDRAGGHITPKFHMLVHCFQRSVLLGNPRFSMTYRDESLNGVVARIAASCHRNTWAETVHCKFNYLLHCPEERVNMDMH